MKKTKNDKGQDVFDVVILDSKLNVGTNWTPNQGAGQKKKNFTIKTIDQKNRLRGDSIDELSDFTNKNENPISLQLKQKFIKIYSDGKGNYKNITD